MNTNTAVKGVVINHIPCMVTITHQGLKIAVALDGSGLVGYWKGDDFILIEE